MRKFLPSMLLASCALGLGLAAGSLVATANYSPDIQSDDAAHAFDTLDVTPPVAGDDLFVEQAATDSCMSHDRVATLLLADQAEFGGQAVKVSDDRHQAFADTWRAAAGLDALAVSGIVGHIYFDEAATDWMVDVVEFDADGCAATRTIMPGEQWTYLLRNSGRI